MLPICKADTAAIPLSSQGVSCIPLMFQTLLLPRFSDSCHGCVLMRCCCRDYTALQGFAADGPVTTCAAVGILLFGCCAALHTVLHCML
jgi:hypothetical protein